MRSSAAPNGGARRTSTQKATRCGDALTLPRLRQAVAGVRARPRHSASLTRRHRAPEAGVPWARGRRPSWTSSKSRRCIVGVSCTGKPPGHVSRSQTACESRDGGSWWRRGERTTMPARFRAPATEEHVAKGHTARRGVARAVASRRVQAPYLRCPTMCQLSATSGQGVCGVHHNRNAPLTTLC